MTLAKLMRLLQQQIEAAHDAGDDDPVRLIFDIQIEREELAEQADDAGLS
jgi:hypothetical protein